MIDINTLTNEEKMTIYDQLCNMKQNEAYNHRVDLINSHRKYVGKAYRNGEKYYYVLSAKSTSEYEAECMVFDLNEKYTESYYMPSTFSTDSLQSEIIFEGIHVENVPLFENKNGSLMIDTLVQISDQLYFSAMNLFVSKLQSLMISGELNTSKDELKHR